MLGAQLIETLGSRAIVTAREVGGIGVLCARVLRALVPP